MYPSPPANCRHGCSNGSRIVTPLRGEGPADPPIDGPLGDFCLALASRSFGPPGRVDDGPRGSRLADASRIAVPDLDFDADLEGPAPTGQSLKLSVLLCSGEEIAVVEAMRTWRSADVLAALPRRDELLSCGRRLLLGDVELGGRASLAEIGAVDRSSLTLVKTARPLVATASGDCTAKLWAIGSSPECLLTLTGHTGHVFSAVFSPDGQQVLTASKDNTAKIWSVCSGECVRTLSEPNGVRTAVFSPDSRRVLTASFDGSVKIWSAESGERLLSMETAHESMANSAVFSPNGRRALSASDDGTAKIWCAVTGECLRTLDDIESAVSHAVFSPDGQHVLTCSDDVAQLWSVDSGECVRTFEGHGPRVVEQPDAFLAELLSSLNAANPGQPLHVTIATYVWRVAFSPDGCLILTTSNDCTVKIWSAASGSCLRTLVGHQKSVCSAVFSPDGQQVLTGSADGTAKLWSADSGECLCTLEGHSEKLWSAAFSLA